MREPVASVAAEPDRTIRSHGRCAGPLEHGATSPFALLDAQAGVLLRAAQRVGELEDELRRGRALARRVARFASGFVGIKGQAVAQLQDWAGKDSKEDDPPHLTDPEPEALGTPSAA